MTIPFSKYVRITSGVAGGAGVKRRDLIARIFTGNPLVSPGDVLEFADVPAVSAYFGSGSPEAAIASRYFGWVSPLVGSPRAIGFARYAGGQAVAAAIYGNAEPKSLTELQAIAAGSITLDLDSVPHVISALDFSAATSFADCASVLETALNLDSEPAFSTATVAYDATSRRFVVTSGVPGDGAIVAQPGAVSEAMGLLAENGAINIAGTGPLDAAATFNASLDVSDNFGSFLFLDTLPLTDTVAVAAANASQNVRFMYCVPVSAANVSAWAAALEGFAGCALTLTLGDRAEMIPAIVLAATNFSQRNGTMGYMFRMFPGVAPSVTSGAESDNLDALRVNYYGRTQTAGQKLDFYQRGVLMGGPGDAVDMNVYANEQWLKDAAGSELMGLFLNLGQLPANDNGRGQVLTALQVVIDAALYNGAISAGKTLSLTQRQRVVQLTGDALAWHQVQDIGYWVDCVIEEVATQDGRIEYRAVYQLIYSKNDAIRSIDGTHVLI